MDKRIIWVSSSIIAVLLISMYFMMRNKNNIASAYNPVIIAPNPVIIAPPPPSPSMPPSLPLPKAPTPLPIAVPPVVAISSSRKSIFDIMPPNSDLLATNINKWYGIIANTNPNAPGVVVPSGPVNPTNLINYFKHIWPNMAQLPDTQLQTIYLGLDCWYLNYIPQLAPKVSNEMYTVDRLPTLSSIDGNQGIEYARLFDSTVCDCLRISYKTCVYSKDRLTAMALKACPLWDGIRSIVTPKWLLKRAFDSDNPDTNYRKDLMVRQGMSGKKGFPSYSYYEGIVYPGEYGVTEFCTTTDKYDPYWKLNQAGLKSGSKDLIMSNQTSPWFNEQDCSSKDCQKDYFLDDTFKCVKITSDGSFGPAGNFSKCLRESTFTEEFEIPKQACCGSDSNIETFSTDFSTNCPGGGFPKAICPEVNPKDYREYWTYPQIGCGMWHTVGKSIAVNTKLGWLLAPEAEGGCALDFNRLMEIRGSTNAIEQNLVQQVNRVAAIIKNGQVTATAVWPAMNIDMLKKHGYTGSQVSDSQQSMKAAMDLVKYWYMEGYTGYENGILNGFNYNYVKYFPLGTHFSYASKFDNIILGMMTIKGLDSVQLMMEPQNASVGLRPAYMFEVISKKPTTKAGLEDSAFQDTRSIQCKAIYSLDPSQYIGNYMKFGYLPKSVVTNPKLLDPVTFKARMESKSFIPV